MRLGTGPGLLLGLVGVAVGIYFGFFFESGGAPPYRLHETLPKMVADFGSGARVVEILASSESVTYEVIGKDGLLHQRDYGISYSRLAGGATGKSRKVTNVVRRATVGELRDVGVRIGDIAPGVVDRLLAEVRFPEQGSSATFAGGTWTVESGARPFDRYEGAV